MNRKLSHPLRGIITPMVTPLTARDKLDVGGLERLVEHILRGGVQGVFILGSCGEGPSLSYTLRHEMIERVCDQVDQRVPVLVGITDTSSAESIRMAWRAAEVGAAAVMLAPPCYFPATQSELQAYVANLVSRVPLPVILYNMPQYTKVSLSLETIQYAMSLPQVIGIKDSSGSMIQFHHLLQLAQHRPDFSILMGPEELLADALLFGAHGGVVGGSNLDPKLYVDLHRAAVAGDAFGVIELQQRVLRLAQSIYGVAKDENGVIKGLKCALAWMGICNDQVAEPLQSLNNAERQLVRERLEQLGIPITRWRSS